MQGSPTAECRIIQNQVIEDGSSGLRDGKVRMHEMIKKMPRVSPGAKPGVLYLEIA
jgi:hypothetical protein